MCELGLVMGVRHLINAPTPYVRLPGLAERGDVSDWLDADATRASMPDELIVQTSDSIRPEDPVMSNVLVIIDRRPC
jgi:hypothetical protein